MTTALRMDRWCLYGLQTYNWGGFNGHFQLDPAPPTEVTVISGDSGTGKSTLMDAVSALLHPGRDFNRASSGSGSSPRSIPTYVRGRYGKDSDGRNTVYYDLRGGRATWSGVALTWCNIDGRTLTMFSAWYMNKHDEAKRRSSRPHRRTVRHHQPRPVHQVTAQRTRLQTSSTARSIPRHNNREESNPKPAMAVRAIRDERPRKISYRRAVPTAIK